MDGDNLLLHLMEIKAHESLEVCSKLKVRNTEELEDLLFHIRTYTEIPLALAELKYPEFRGVNIKKMLKEYRGKKLKSEIAKRYSSFIIDIEKQRAVERDFIFEHAKVLSFGFEF